MPNKVSFFAPGKLFIAGEYAVTESNGEAILFPVKKGITVTIESQPKSMLRNIQYPNENIKFKEIHEIQNPYLRLALEVMRQWVTAQHIKWKHIKITIDSSLVADQGKYGLGSSGAVTVALIGALLKFYKFEFTPRQLYQLAVIATIQNYQDTSFGDIACSSYNQPIHYRKFAKTMIPLIKTLHVHTLLKMEWKDLMIEPIQGNMQKPLVIFSGTSANSYDMVNRVKSSIHEDWVKQSNQLITQYLNQQNVEIVDKLQKHLLKLSQLSGVDFITSNMSKIMKVAEDLGGHSKMSGAGGGDCVLTFLPRANHSKFKTKMKELKFLVLSDII
ncbi:MAG: phosphomevalonate kinase [Bacilli bacterium]